MSLRVFTNGTDTVVAKDLPDVQRLVEAHYGATFRQEGWELQDWHEVPGDKPITIVNLNDHGPSDKATMTAAQWAAHEGRSFLCSTEW